MSNNVTHPNHYCKGGIECIEAIKAAVSGITDPFEAYCTGNIIKYAWRWSDKNGVEDLAKAKQYIDFIKEYRESKTKAPHTTYLEEMGEEDVRESTPDPKQSKYEGLSDMGIADRCCEITRGCRACPLYSGGLCTVFTADLSAKRAKMIAYLTEQDKAKEGKE